MFFFSLANAATHRTLSNRRQPRRFAALTHSHTHTHTIMKYTHSEIALLHARRLINDAMDTHTQLLKLHYIVDETQGNLNDIDAVDSILRYLNATQTELTQALSRLKKTKRLVECSTHTLR